MLISYLYQQRILSKQFVLKQIGFEKQMYQKITTNCGTDQQKNLSNTDKKPQYEESNQSYRECAQNYKQKIKHFGLMTQLLVQQRARELKNSVDQKCKIHKQEDQILNCVNNLVHTQLMNKFQQDFAFIDLARNEILKTNYQPKK